MFSSLSSDVKGLSLPGKKEGFIEPYQLPGTAPVLYFSIIIIIIMFTKNFADK